MQFGDVIPISISLNGVLGKISGATIILTISQGGFLEREEPLTTDSHGVVSFNLVGLLSGTHTVTVSFLGSVTQAPSSVEMSLMVTPVVVLNIEPTSNLYIGYYCTVNLSVTVLGTAPDWNGTLDAWLFDPTGEEVGQWTLGIGVFSILSIGFNARMEGTHMFNTTISGLPVVINQDYPMRLTVVNESLQLQLDAGTTTILGGFGILAVVGVVLRKKMRGVVGLLPGEWSE